MFTSLDLANHFGFKVINGDLEALKRPIKVAELDRPGLELLGDFDFHQKDRIMVIGNKELAVIKDKDDEFIYKNAVLLCDEECPAVIITHGKECPKPILKAAQDKKCPLFSSDADTSRLFSDLYVYLTEALAPKTALHACLLEIYGIGVLLTGESGIGKSEISLDLIKKGHRLIADDRVNIKDVRGKLIGSCPESIYGMMEVRGIGIIDVPRMFGINSLSKNTRISLVVHLVSFNKNEPMERVGMKTDRIQLLNEQIPMVKLPVSAARSMSEIIEAAVTNFKLKDYGYDTGYEFQKRLQAIEDRREQEKRQAMLVVNRQNLKNIISMNPEPDHGDKITVGNINPESSNDDIGKVKILKNGIPQGDL